jgi:RNA polymerase sigma factor for flagellar operon FliA
LSPPPSPRHPPPDLAGTLPILDAALGSLERRIPRHVSREDLASAGKLALVKALLRFEGSPDGARAYCYVCVRGAILDELRRLDPLSRYTRDRIEHIRRTAALLEHRSGRVPTQAQLATATGLPLRELARLEQLADSARPTYQAGAGDDAAINALADGNAPCPARTAESGDATHLIQAAIDRLGWKQAFVLRRYHLEDATLEQLAKELALSKERVRQIREAAEQQLREDFVVLALWQSFFTRGGAD